MSGKRVFWWTRGCEGWRRGNFGDEMNRFILEKLEVPHKWVSPEQSELVLAGSILEHLPDRWPGVVCGSGKLKEHSQVDLSNARVFALRGKLTEAAAGLRHPVALGDLGLLMPRWVAQPSARHDLGVVAHWSDTQLFKRFSYGHLIDVNQPVAKVVEEIASCKRIISSSLHGIVVADAYGIPRQAEMFEQNPLHDGGDFKFRDYASIYDDHPHFGEMWIAPRKTVERAQVHLLSALSNAIGVDASQTDPVAPQISMLVPFRDDGEHRTRTWRWLRDRWHSRLPGVEIIEGHTDSIPFSKSDAINNAASLARGRVFAIIDADTYLDPQTILRCADNIEASLAAGHRLWYMPYDKLHRLSEHKTLELLSLDPRMVPSVTRPTKADHDASLPPMVADNAYHNGHLFGAMAMIMPREAFVAVEGMDERFKAWGGEDGSFLRSLDTLYAQHEVVEGHVVHLWHARIGDGFMTRRWVGQTVAGVSARLAQRYVLGMAEPVTMRGLADEHRLGWPFRWTYRQTRGWGTGSGGHSMGLPYDLAVPRAVIEGTSRLADDDAPGGWSAVKRSNPPYEGEDDMADEAFDPIALRTEVVSLLTDAESVLTIVAKFDDLPGIDKIAPFVTKAETVLADVLAFLEGGSV